MRAPLVAAGALVAAQLLGCSLTSKSPPLDIRWVTTEAVGRGAAPEARPPADGPALRMGRTASSAHLRRRVVYREAERALGSYEAVRWTENPEELARRAVHRALFVEQRLRQVLVATAPTLDVEVLAFEEVRRGGARAGLVRIAYVLRDERAVLAAGEAIAEEPARSAELPEIVRAISAALDRASGQIAVEVSRALPGPAAGARGPETPGDAGKGGSEP